MDLVLRKSQPADLPFLEEMLYEAAFWRAAANKPKFEEGLAHPSGQQITGLLGCKRG